MEDMRFVASQFMSKKPAEHSLINEGKKSISIKSDSDVTADMRKRGYVVKDANGIHIKVG